MSPITTASLWAQVNQGGKREFLVTADDMVSFADLGTLIRRWLAWFDECGLQPGDRFVIRTHSEIAQITAFIAGMLDGVVPVLLSSDTPNPRIEAIARSVGAGGFVGGDGDPPTLDPGVPRLILGVRRPDQARGVFRRAAVDHLPGLAPQTSRPPRAPVTDEGLAYILFTSGTTSDPVGVPVSRRNLFANLETQVRVFGYTSRSRIFNDMVLAHADGIGQGPVMALACGGALIRSGGFELRSLEAWLDRVRSQRATHIITVPTVWAMIDAYAAHDDYFDAPECEALLSVASKLPEDLWRRLEARFKRPVFNQYGLTETVATALWAGPRPEMGRFGTIGKPIDCEARIAPDAAEGVGELQLRGPNIFTGYWRSPQRTAAAFTADGWLKTGDVARLRDDGAYAFLGRLKTVIMMGGLLIRPDEIDEAMLRHPAVRESVTIGFEDPMFGETPVTAVTLSMPVGETALTSHARANLEARKVPKRIVIVDEIPRGDAGKARLPALKALLEAEVNTPFQRPAGSPAAGWEPISEVVRQVAADVFRVDPKALGLASKPGSVKGWDSFSHLNFVMAVEQRFSIHIPAARITQIVTLADMVKAVEDLAS